MIPTGDFTYTDLWPTIEIGKDNFSSDVNSAYTNSTVTLEQLIKTDVTKLEGYSPDGALKIITNYDTDQQVLKNLQQHVKNNPKYNGVSNNCSDYARTGVESALGGVINATEKIAKGISSTTPNKLFQAAKDAANVSVLKNPGDKINNRFFQVVTGGGINQEVAEKKVQK